MLSPSLKGLDHREKLLGDFGQLPPLQIILRHPGIYLSETRDELNVLGVDVSVPSTCRTLKEMGCSREVLCRGSSQRSDMRHTYRAQFMAEVSVYDPSMFVWLDETGTDACNTIRKYGYSRRGMLLCNQRLRVRGKWYTAIPIFSGGNT